ADYLRRPGVFYAWLPVTLEPMTARVAGRLLFHHLIAAARVVTSPRVQNYLIIDEGQEVANTRDVGGPLKQARDRGISAWFSVQQLADLQGATVDLVPAVTGNTRLRWYFGVRDLPGLEFVTRTSGEVIRRLYSRTQTQGQTPSGGTASTALQEREY